MVVNGSKTSWRPNRRLRKGVLCIASSLSHMSIVTVQLMRSKFDRLRGARVACETLFLVRNATPTRDD